MSSKKYKGTLYDLLQAGDTITGAATDAGNAPRLNLRLQPPFVADTVDLIADIRAKQAGRAGKQGDLATFTLAQQNLVRAVMDQAGRARETAKRAFKGNSVKLHDEFRVGQGTNAVNVIMGDARIIAASLKKPENQPGLTAKGWLASDTQKLDDAIAAAADALKTETHSQGDEVGLTVGVNQEADDLYDRLRDIQNAADLEWPDDGTPDNVTVRAEFLLGVFPYGNSGGGNPPPTPPPAPPHP